MQPNVQVHPISALTPFMGSSRQYIRARVSDKSDIKTWAAKPGSNGQGGQLFSCCLNDESAAIRATFFNAGVANFFHVIEVGRVYILGGFQVKNANRKWSSVDNDYELSFDGQSEVHVCNDVNVAIPTQRYSFVPFNLLKMRPADSRIDVLCVLKSIGETSTFPNKNPKPGKPDSFTRMGCVVADSTGAVELTVWNDKIASFNYAPGTVLAIKEVTRGDFGGVSLSTTMSTTIVADPNMPDTQALKRWWSVALGNDVPMLTEKGGGANPDRDKLAQNHGRQWLSAIETRGMSAGTGDDKRSDIFESLIYITKVKFDKYYYEACDNPQCRNKKVTEGNGVWTCSVCNKQFMHPVYRYIINCEITDGVTIKWATMFDQEGQVFMGCTAGELKNRLAQDDAAEMKAMQSRLNMPYVAKIQVKRETYTKNQQDGAGEQGTATRINLLSLDPLMTQSNNSVVMKHNEKDANKVSETLKAETMHMLNIIQNYGNNSHFRK